MATRLLSRAAWSRAATPANGVGRHSRRTLHASRRLQVVKPFLLADIGEGIRECQIIQWFVQPGARVEQFDKLCEVQSDKAATDITSPFDGIVRRLCYEPDDMAIVGKPLLEIDIQSDISPENESKLGLSESESETPQSDKKMATSPTPPAPDPPHARKSSATPAVRHLLKQRGLDISAIEGTGKDGRVTKDDVHRHTATSSPTSARRSLTPVQMAMFNTMTRSLSIPHFLYSLDVDMTPMASLRQKINSQREPADRLTPLPFIVKAISLALSHHPLLNAALDTSSPSGKPELLYNPIHNFGIAVDTPSGLLVPVIRDVSSRNVTSIAIETRRLGDLARQGKLQPWDFEGGTVTISNIGSIGGGVVAPIIVSPQVAIVGVGRSRVVPDFDERGQVVPRERLVLSWSADHRIVDGAECARAAERVRGYLEEPQEWLLELA